MSDRDPLQQLASFDSGPVAPLAAAEVRRLGDRRRARLTAVSVVAGITGVLAVVVPAGLYAARDGGASPTPPSSSHSTAGKAAIPDDFPLDHGFAAERGQVTAPTHGDLGITPVDLCGETGWHQPTDRLGTWLSSDAASQWRELVLFDSTADAAGAVDHFRDAVQGCRTERFTDRDGTGSDVQIDGRTSPVAGDSVAWHRSGTDGVFDSTTVLRVGDAVLLVSAADATTGDGVTTDPDRTVDAAARWLSTRMCTLPGAECGDADSQAADRIPADFPLTLDQHAMVGDGGELTGPGRDVVPDMFTLCADESRIFSMPYADRLASVATGPEYADSRQLTTYASAADAAAQMETVRGWLADCPAWSSMVVHRYTADTGYHDTVTFGTTCTDGLCGQLVQVVRVGRAILALGHTGEFDAASQRDGVPALTQLTKRILPAMCTFTADGCESPSPGQTLTNTAHACTGSDLTASLAQVEGAAGSAYVEARFTNTSGHACTVAGATAIQAITEAGPAVRSKAVGLTPFELPAGRYASATIRDANPGVYDATECRPSPVKSWRVQVPGSDRDLSLTPNTYNDACVAVSNLSIEPWQPVLDGH